MEKKKVIVLTSLIILLVITITVAVSYAYWSVSKEGTQENIVTSGCFDMEIIGERKIINLQNAYPITDAEANGLTPYTFTVKNTCSIYASYNINLEALEGSTLGTSFIAVKVNNEAKAILGELDSATKAESSSVESRTIITGALGAGDEVEYTVRIWMDERVTLEDDVQNKLFKGKIVLDAKPSNYSPYEKGITLLNEALLVNEYQIEDVNEAKTRIQAKGTPDTTKTAPIMDWQEVHSSSTITDISSLPHPDLINQYGVTEPMTKLFIGTSYEFNMEKGNYTIKNYSSLDPTTLDYVNNDYYYCRSWKNVNVADQTITAIKPTKCDIMYKIKSATKYDSSSGFNKEIKYKLDVYEYKQQASESNASDKGMYIINDSVGANYIYRGNVKNNYVSFAGYLWKVVRINSDNSIRLMYYNPLNQLTNNVIANTKYNIQVNDPTYVGYMYSNTLNTSYNDTVSNDNSSNAKIVLDNWYENNIENKNLTKYIADSGFCNDRSLKRGNGYSNQSSEYKGHSSFINSNLSLNCNKNDNFTITETDFGNGKLTYAIGLITADELIYAGLIYKGMNPLNYLAINNEYYTMSAAYYEITLGSSHVVYYNTKGYLDSDGTTAANRGIRPVINLKADTTITGGTGTSNDPFIVDTSA